jgi:tetratricopeptide (TPR) repeat protein
MNRLLAHVVTAGLLATTGAFGRAEPEVAIPKAARERYEQGQALEKQGKLKEALEAYQEAINLGMQLYPRAHLKEARAFLELKEYDAALGRFTKFIDGFGLEDSCRY